VLDDGTAGLMAIKQMGGVAVVQEPADALYAGMPQSAISNVVVDYCLPAADLSDLLVRLADEPIAVDNPGHWHPPAEFEQEAHMAELEPEAVHADRRPGPPSVFACPECGGTLWEFHEHDLLRFRCRVGHAWSAESLLAEQTQGLEAALWSALRALEEQSALSRRMAERAAGRGHDHTAHTFRGQGADAEAHAEVIRRVLVNRRPDTSTELFDPAEPEAVETPPPAENRPAA